MSQSYEACIVVGVHRDDFSTENEDLIDDGDVELFCPYYDGSEEAIVGLQYASSGEYDSSEFTWDQEKIDQLKTKFKELTGQDGKVWLTPHAW